MNDLESRLKDAYSAATDTVTPDKIRELNEQSVLITWPGSKRPRPERRWVMPVTAAATVAVIAAVALPSLLTPARGRPAGAAPLGERFLSSLKPNSQKFFIINALSGVKVAVVSPPSAHEIFRTAVTEDGINYVTAVARPGACGTRLYKFRLNSAGKPSPLTPFDGGRPLQDVTMLAVSAGENAFVYLVHACPPAKSVLGNLYFTNFKTGLRRRWFVGSFSRVNGISLSEDGSTLAVGGTFLFGARSAIGLIDTSGKQGAVASRGRLLVTGDNVGRHHKFSVALPTITPDGRTVFFVSIGPGRTSPGEQIRSMPSRNEYPKHIRLVARTTSLTDLAIDPSARRAIGIHQAGPRPPAFMINLGTGQITYLKPSFYLPAGGRYIW